MRGVTSAQAGCVAPLFPRRGSHFGLQEMRHLGIPVRPGPIQGRAIHHIPVARFRTVIQEQFNHFRVIHLCANAKLNRCR
jgi:hypothetical protein